MKSYKLIKEYPGSPKLGFIVKFKPEYPYVRPAEIEAGVECSLSLEECKKYHEFWEEVVEKEYEILSFEFNGKTFSGECTDGKYWSNEGTWTYLGFDPSRETIISVKRLSDGEVFTIGDYLDLKSKRDYLYEIRIIDNELRFKADFQKNSSWATSYTLNFINHSKKPLFTTKDGVDIFEGDNVHFVCDDFDYHYLKNVDNNHCGLINCGKLGLYKIFKTKEAAEKYILMNKPCLSLNEILTAASKPSTFEDHIKILEKLVKSKL